MRELSRRLIKEEIIKDKVYDLKSRKYVKGAIKHLTIEVTEVED